jgi:hypothetical protein
MVLITDQHVPYYPFSSDLQLMCLETLLSSDRFVAVENLLCRDAFR